jgi:hypothetical protein
VQSFRHPSHALLQRCQPKKHEPEPCECGARSGYPSAGQKLHQRTDKNHLQRGSRK